MKWVFLLCICLLALPVQAVDLLCPYEVSTGDGELRRDLSLLRFLPALRTDQGHPPGQLWEEDEVGGSTRTAPNQAVVTLPGTVLGATLALLKAAPPAGGGCTDKPVDFRAQPARVPRRSGGVLVYDRLDDTRETINPHRERAASFLTRMAQRLLPSLRMLWASNPFLARLASALGTFPDVPTSPHTDEFTRANQTPLTSPWASLNTTQTMPNLAGNLVDCVSVSHPYWTTRVLASSTDVIAQFPATAATVGVVIRMKEPGSLTHDGYRVALPTGDVIRLERVEDSVPVTLGSPPAQVRTDGDWLGVRTAGDVLSTYHKTLAGAWSAALQTVTDSTFPQTGFGGIHCGSAAPMIDNFSVTALVALGTPPAAGFRRLQ